MWQAIRRVIGEIVIDGICSGHGDYELINRALIEKERMV
jgi:hypothetical protein